MASIRKSMSMGVDAARAWEAFRDVGSVHTRLARGFVTHTELEGDTRSVTFANGLVVREKIVTIDDGARRLVYRHRVGGRRITTRRSRSSMTGLAARASYGRRTSCRTRPLQPWRE